MRKTTNRIVADVWISCFVFCALIVVGCHQPTEPDVAMSSDGRLVEDVNAYTIFSTPGEVPLCISRVSGDVEGPEVLVGYSSGKIFRLAVDRKRPQVEWESKLDGSVIAILPIEETGMTGPDFITSSNRGAIAAFGWGSEKPLWEFASPCEVSNLVQAPDVDGDGMLDVAVAGADEHVRLLSGKNGKPIWDHLLVSKHGDAYLLSMGMSTDHDGDGFADIAVWEWNGNLVMLSTRTGNELWCEAIGMGLSGSMAIVPDMNGDGHGDLLVGGNDQQVRLCSGADGAVLWTAVVNNPVRDIDVCLSPVEGGSGVIDVVAFVGTSGGEVVRLHPVVSETPGEVQWEAKMGDVCRDVIVMSDVDGDGEPDVGASAENGVVRVFSGKSGKVLRDYAVGEVARMIQEVHDGESEALAVASLEESVYLFPLSVRSARVVVENEDTDVAINESAMVAREVYQPESASATRSSGPDGQSRVIILLYHDVLPEAHNLYATSADTFKKHMGMLLEEGYVCVSLDQIADWIEGKGLMPARAVCITFDGQYTGQYTCAYPILREMDLFATSYITTDWIGTPNHSDWNELREMEKSGVMDIQNHTVSHPPFTKVDEAEIARQLHECNDAIRRHLNGKDVRHHAYPGGYLNREVLQFMRKQGFRTCTTVRKGPVDPDRDLLRLQRYMYKKTVGLDEFRSWLTGVEPEVNHQ